MRQLRTELLLLDVVRHFRATSSDHGCLSRPRSHWLTRARIAARSLDPAHSSWVQILSGLLSRLRAMPASRACHCAPGRDSRAAAARALAARARASAGSSAPASASSRRHHRRAGRVRAVAQDRDVPLARRRLVAARARASGRPPRAASTRARRGARAAPTRRARAARVRERHAPSRTRAQSRPPSARTARRGTPRRAQARSPQSPLGGPAEQVERERWSRSAAGCALTGAMARTPSKIAGCMLLPYAK